MPKEGRPEEFFEVFGAISRKSKHPAQQPEESPPSPDASASARPAPAAPAEPTEPQPDGDERRYPLSVFAEDEPKVTIRRSTLIFAGILVLVLLFVAYALGRRARRRTTRPATTTSTRDGMRETSRPALPGPLRDKCAVHMKVLDHTQQANAANARAYRDFLRTSPDATFIKSAGKKAFIISHSRRLVVCVGPFDSLQSADLNEMLPKLRELRYNHVQLFARARVQPLPLRAKLFE